MKKIAILSLFIFTTTLAPTVDTRAQIPIVQLVTDAIKKVIKAIDLNVQRLQNQTVNLQNLQKEIENRMSKLKLDQINDWAQKQRQLYQDYYKELQKVKSTIAYYHKVKDISEKQLKILQEYRRAWNLFRQDKHFSNEELQYMQSVYDGILDQSAQNIDELAMIITEFKTSMTDAERLSLIDAASEMINKNYYDLVRFNQQNSLLSLQRAKSERDINTTKAIYNLR